MSRQMCGGFGESKEATAEEQELVNIVKAAVEAKLEKSLSVLQAIDFTSQVVAGVIYLIKVKADDETITLKILKSLPHHNKAPELMEIVN